MNLKLRIFIGFLVTSLLVGGAYLAENISRTQGLSSSRMIKVMNNGKTAAYINDEILEKLIKKETEDDGALQGMALASAVNAAGAGQFFKEIEVRSSGQKSSITFKSNEINDDLILSFAGSGKINLCRKRGKEVLVEEVSEIDVKN